VQNKPLCTQLSCVFYPGDRYGQDSKRPPVCQSQCDNSFFQSHYIQDCSVASLSFHHKICQCKSVMSFILALRCLFDLAFDLAFDLRVVVAAILLLRRVVCRSRVASSRLSVCSSGENLDKRRSTSCILSDSCISEI
jgi:hypothetical protein